jgi:DNA-binding NarL/FixJ family response regulator
VSDATVKAHINHIFSKFGAQQLAGHRLGTPARLGLTGQESFAALSAFSFFFFFKR